MFFSGMLNSFEIPEELVDKIDVVDGDYGYTRLSEFVR